MFRNVAFYLVDTWRLFVVLYTTWTAYFVNIPIYQTTVLPVVLYGCETWGNFKERMESVQEQGAEEDICN
jgi:hypothetical protein